MSDLPRFPGLPRPPGRAKLSAGGWVDDRRGVGREEQAGSSPTGRGSTQKRLENMQEAAMRRRVWETLALVSAVTLGAILDGNIARAAGWADRLFTEQGHDFGPVPRGAKVRHAFALTNRLSEPVTI